MRTEKTAHSDREVPISGIRTLSLTHRLEYPNDPIKRIIFPDPGELNGSGSPDPSQEKKYTVQHGLQHKYPQTALLLLSDVCGGICRFCFRKRLFMDCERQTIRDYAPALGYVRDHPEVTDVLLSGGDPFILATSRLKQVIREIREIDHVGIIRIGTKMLAYNPYRITEDPDLIDLIRGASGGEKKIYVMAHFNHPNEISSESVRAIGMLQQAGAIIVNQTPIIEGVNNNAVVLADLFKKLSFVGVSPYYVFQCRPTIGNYIYSVPVEESFWTLQKAFKRCSELAKRARFIMSHSTGKIEVVGMNNHNIFMRYHQAADPENYEKFMISCSNAHARWFDDYEPFTPGTGPIREWLFDHDPAAYSGTATY
ncbi:KamA family radical SAM protein [Methanospirillum sp.]|uniref:KamA family radical SAM protein n=1 Tax=Methanospirillum sp. TaxID=45200 RepID=UPI002CF14195|nr:KamA family radical SAM protein [Methanospirillum sp.]HPP77211.1 KamA family radical SAM protein [Methanospirillum sp.]